MARTGFFYARGPSQIMRFGAKASETIAIGDLVCYDNATGYVDIATATDTALLGVALSSVSSATAGDAILVECHPDAIFTASCSGTSSQALVFDKVDIEGATTAMQINENASTYGVIQLLEPVSAVGANAVHYCKIAKHSLGEGIGPIGTADLGADCVTGAKIADDAIDSEHYTDGSIDTAHLAADCVDGTKIADDAIDSEHYTDGSIDTAHLAADCVDGTKIADDAIDSEHYTDGSIDTAHLAADCVDGTKIADDAIDSEHYTDGSIDTAHLSADCVDGTKIADDAIDSEHYVDGSIDTAHIANLQITTALLAADAVDGTKIADDAIDSEHYVDGSIDNAHLAANSVDSANYVDNSIDPEHFANVTKGALGQTLVVHQTLTSTAGTYDVLASAPFKCKIIDWWIRKEDTTASNVKLNDGSNDITSDVAAGATDNAIVRGGDIIDTYEEIAASGAIKAITSGNAAMTVFVMVVPVA